MVVGFSISGLQDSSQQQEFAKYLKATCILEAGVADEIAKRAAENKHINLFTEAATLAELQGGSAYNFAAIAEEIEVDTSGSEYLVANAVNFRLELVRDGEIFPLAPTEYFRASYEEVEGLIQQIRQGLVRTFPPFIGEDISLWILATGYWNDGGLWIDSALWKDG